MAKSKAKFEKGIVERKGGNKLQPMRQKDLENTVGGATAIEYGLIAALIAAGKFKV